jgi:flagellin-like hook-associated protein FlgL
MPTLSTIGQSTLIRNETAKVQLQINTLQQQVTSGFKTDRYGDLGSLASLDISLRNRGAQIETFKVNIQTVNARTEIIDNTLGSLRETVLEVRNLALANKNFDTGRVDLISRARNAVFDVMQKLQANVDGRFLFSGTMTSTPPTPDPATLLADAKTAVTTDLGAAPPDIPLAVNNAVATVLGTGSYYAGALVTHSAAEIEQNVSVPYSILGNDPAFEDALEGLLMIASLDPPVDDPATPPDIGRNDWDATVNAAAGILTNALSGIETLQLQNGRAQQILDDTLATHDVTLTIIQKQINDIELVDLVDVSARLTQLRTQLAASFSITAELKDLSLVNFLR